MTFRDLTFHLTCILLYLMLDCLIFLIIYLNQDKMGEDNVFLTYFTTCLISDIFFGIFLPSRLLLRSRSQYPRFWSRTKFDEKNKIDSIFLISHWNQGDISKEPNQSKDRWRKTKFHSRTLHILQ